MAWNEAVITTTGMDLLAKCLTEGNIVITRAVGGESCSAALSLLTLNSIKEPCHEMNLFRIENEGGKIVVNLRVQNKGLEEEYTLRQIGLFAKLEDEDSEVLLAVIQDGTGEVIPKESENPEFLVEFDFVIPVSNTENIDVAVTPNTFATADDILKQEKALEAHTSDKANPHAVTKAQVGLGNVPNVATNDQTPTYTEANTLTELSSGEKLSVAFGKLAKAVKTLISHIADNVKHITAAERTAWNGKAAGDHTHSAATQSAAGLMSANDKKKLDGVAASANNYSLPAASSTARGGVKIGYAANGRNYPVQLSNEKMYVNVPWTDNNTTYSNMTAATASAAGRAGLVPAPAAGAQAKYLRGDGTWQTPPDTNTTYSAATQSANGLMSAADKTKLDGIATGANKYTHPTTAGNKHIPSGGSSGQILRWSADGTAVWGNDNNTTYSNMKGASASADGAAGLVPAPTKGNQAKYLRADGTWQTPPDTNTTYSAATQSAAGLMSANDKKKLDGVAASANNYSLPAASSTARGGVKIGYAANGRNYPVQLSNEKMYVNVPDNLVEILTGHVVTSTNATPTISNSEGSHILIKLRGRSSNNAVSGYGIDECWIRNYRSISGSTTVTLYNGTIYETNITVTPNGAVNLKCTSTLSSGYRIEYTLQYYR